MLYYADKLENFFRSPFFRVGILVLVVLLILRAILRARQRARRRKQRRAAARRKGSYTDTYRGGRDRYYN